MSRHDDNRQRASGGLSFVYGDGQQFSASVGDDGFSIGVGDVPESEPVTSKKQTERIPAAYIAAGGAAALLLLLLVLAKK